MVSKKKYIYTIDDDCFVSVVYFIWFWFFHTLLFFLFVIFFRSERF
jgi:hypothetical protein